MVGISGGLMFAGLLLGAMTGNIWLLLGFFAAGLVVAAAIQAVQLLRDKEAASCNFKQYPPYGY